MHLLFASIFFLRNPKCFQLRTTFRAHFCVGKVFKIVKGMELKLWQGYTTEFFVNLLKYNPIMFSFRIHSEGQNLFWMYANPKCIIMDTITSRNLRKSQTWSLSSFYLGQLIQNKNLFYQYWHMLPLPWFWAFKVSIWSEKYIIKSLTPYYVILMYYQFMIIACR